jgi:hypothetical protein
VVVGFLYKHGVDVRETPIWDLDWLVDEHARVVGKEPLRVEVVVTADDEELVLTLDESLAVLDHRRGNEER